MPSFAPRLTRVLRGTRIQLDAINSEDIDTLVQWYGDSEFLRLFDTSTAYPLPREHLQRYIMTKQNSATDFVFAIRRLGDPGMLGYIELVNIEWNNGVGQVGIGIGDPAQRGKGYGREALTLLLDFAFTELNLYRLQLHVIAYNVCAIHLYEKLGFRREGTLRAYVHRDGKRYDLYVYGLLRPEWEVRGALG